MKKECGFPEAVIFDLDDTLLHDDLSLSSFSVDVLRRMRKKGCLIVPASGRALLSMKPYVDLIGCADACIACNGAEIWSGDTRRLLWSDSLPAETARDIALFAESHGCYAQTYEEDRFCFNHHCAYADRYARSARLKGVCVGNLSDYIREPRNKILLMDEANVIASLYKEARERFSSRASITCSKPFYLEFNPLSATKGNALATLSLLLGFSLVKTIAFGDSLNDLPMLEKAGTSVAVSNGWQQIRACCDAVCGTNNEDGPAVFLNEHYLIREVTA